MRVKRWTMTETELRTATRATREAARALMPHIADAAADPAADWSQSSAGASTAQSYNSQSTWDDQSVYSTSTIPRPVTPAPAPPSMPPTPRDTPARPLKQAVPSHRPTPVAPLNFAPIDHAAVHGVPTPPATPRKVVRPAPVPYRYSATATPIPPTPTTPRQQQHLAPQQGPLTPPRTPRLRQPATSDSRSSPSSSSSSSASSSGSGGSASTWTSMPPTPVTPGFGASRSRQPSLSIVDESDMAPLPSAISAVSSKASYRQGYPVYAQWAAGELDIELDLDEDAMDVCTADATTPPPSYHAASTPRSEQRRPAPIFVAC